MSLFKGLDTPFFDSATGEPLAFGFVYFGQPNQNAIANPKVPYANQALSTPLAATQELTIAGKFEQEVWLDGDYSVIITDAFGVQQAEYLIVPEAEGGGGGGSAAWGGITGTLSDQADLQSALDSKANLVPPGRTTSSTAFTLAATDSGQLIELTGASPVITIPTESTLDLGSGFTAMFAHIGTGNLTFSVSGVTLKIPAELSNSVPANAVCAVTKLRSAANTWALYGFLDLS